VVLYVVTLPDPPAGTDFRFTVPGRYLYDVTGITAELTTSGTSGLVMVDASGNGNDGDYTPFGSPPGAMTYEPGLVSGNLAIRGALADGTPRGGATARHPILDFTVDYTFVWWQSCGAVLDGVGVGPVQFIEAGSSGIVTVTTTPGPAGWIEINVRFGSSWLTGLGTVPDDDLPHMLALTYNVGSDTMTVYVDGVAIPWATTGTQTGASPCFELIIGFNESPEIFDEYAFFQAELAGGDVAALYAAGLAGFATWNPAVLALTPVAFYHMDGLTAGAGRQPSLIITNGTTELEAIPTGFPAVSTPGPYRYAWQPALNADSQSSDGTLTTVALPQLLLPAGYTVGARTLDLTGTDQWSNVALWWDDAYMSTAASVTPYVYPPGVRLVYEQNGT
jgi:hypothetical protein